MVQATQTQLTRNALCKLIESNHGAVGLDLSGYDLRGIDLSSDVLRADLAAAGYPYENPPVWYSRSTGGIDLSGAILRGVHLEGALLWRGDFTNTDFTDAHLERADLGIAVLTRAKFCRAHLERSTLARADVKEADFTSAFLEGVDATSVNFADASSLDGVHLAGALLANASFRRLQLRRGVGEEQEQKYLEAKEAYLAIKSGCLTLGRYADASWAYIKERQMEKKANNPLRVWHFYRRQEVPVRFPALLLSLVPFYVRHVAKWSFDWLAELSCGYGERPLRTVGWAGVIISTFAFLYYVAGGLMLTSPAPLPWLRYLEYSLAAFATTSVSGVTPASDIGELLTSIEALFGIATLSLLMFALGNRIARS